MLFQTRLGTVLLFMSVLSYPMPGNSQTVEAVPNTDYTVRILDGTKTEANPLCSHSPTLHNRAANHACKEMMSPEGVQAAVETVLREHPELIFTALEKYSVALVNLIEKASRMREVQVEQEQRLAELTNPKVPEIDVSRPIRGSQDAEITIVEYSDFECPYCRSATATLKEVFQEYEGSLRFVYKHNPLNFHPMAEPSARYFEAIALQSGEEAWRFHDILFEQQDRLADGMQVLGDIAVTLDIDQSQLQRDLESEIVEKRLTQDREEAARFGFDGTPAFLINGVSLIGSRPKQDFVELINLTTSETAQ